MTTVTLAAPTHAAKKVLSETTGQAAHTIHSLLMLMPVLLLEERLRLLLVLLLLVMVVVQVSPAVAGASFRLPALLALPGM